MGLLKKLVQRLSLFIEGYGVIGWFLVTSVFLFVVTCAWSLPVLLFNPWAPYLRPALPAQSSNPSATQPDAQSIQTSLEAITSQLALVTPTAIPQPGLTFNPGLYLVGDDIQPGFYRGQTNSNVLETCYWSRLRELTESTDSIIASDTHLGQFYVEVKATDYALQVSCRLTSIDPNLPQVEAFPNQLAPGMYLIGADILPGPYRGQPGEQPCTWQRLSGVNGDPGSVIASGVETEAFQIEILPSDFALATSCRLDQVD